MSKFLTLLFVVLLALASAGGTVYLTLQINAGEARIAAGRGQLAAGRAELESGKTRLAEGKKEFRHAKRNAVKDWLRGGSTDARSDEERLRGVLQGARDYNDAKKQISEGERKISQGEKQLAAGSQKLRQGQEQLQFAKRARWVTGIAAGLFGILSILLAILWRQALFQKTN